jgi:glucose/arabinose dehydrogenase
MRRKLGLSACALLLATPVLAQDAPPPIGIAPVMLTEPSYVFDTAEQHQLKISVLTKGLQRPFAIEFLPDSDDLLVSSRGGGLSVLHGATTANPRLEAIAGMPVPSEGGGFIGGVQDIALAPDFATSRLIYFTYNEPAPRPESETATPALYSFGKFTLMRGKLENGRVTGVETLFQGGVSAALGSRLVFGKDGKIYATTGGAFGQTSQDLGTIYGKVLRLNADGTIPQDNPFVGRAGAHPAIYTLGHRDQHGLTVDPATGAVFAAEHGPNGGDEVNRIKPGGNYGWPTYTYGRDYDGKDLADLPTAPGYEKPLLVWDPSIAPFGLMFYTGDKFPAWKGNLFVGSARWGEINQTGSLMRVVLGENYGPQRRERLLLQLHQRIIDMVQGPDGLIYVITGGPESAVLRLEPSG